MPDTRRLIQSLLLAAALLVPCAMAPAQQFSVAAGGECPGRVTIRWDGAYPNHRLGICFSSERGTFTLPAGPCCSTILGLSSRNLQLVRVIGSGPQGRGQVSAEAKAQRCGGYIQLIAYTGAYDCPVSNVAQLP